MSRPKGAKNKKKLDAGNPDFNLKDAIPMGASIYKTKDGAWLTPDAAKSQDLDVAVGAILPEDLELERSLQAMLKDQPVIDDDGPLVGVVKKEVERHELLSTVVDDYTPASNLEQLREQAFLAKTEGCDAIEIDPVFAKKVCRDPKLEEVGYFMYHDIKVYLVGALEKAKKRDAQSIEQRLFGHSNEAERRKVIADKIKALEAELA